MGELLTQAALWRGVASSFMTWRFNSRDTDMGVN